MKRIPAPGLAALTNISDYIYTTHGSRYLFHFENILAEYDAWIDFEVQPWDVVFPNEKSATAFILRWS